MKKEGVNLDDLNDLSHCVISKAQRAAMKKDVIVSLYFDGCCLLCNFLSFPLKNASSIPIDKLMEARDRAFAFASDTDLAQEARCLLLGLPIGTKMT